MTRQRSLQRSESGYILAGVMIIMAIAAMVVASNLDLSGSSTRSMLAGAKRSQAFFQSEESFGSSIGWLRENSTSMTDLFGRSKFYTLFDRTSPSVGSNDTSIFTVPTKLKKQGTSDSIILNNHETLATGYFPATIDTMSGSAFNPLSVFQTAAVGGKRVRITLVDAVAVDPAKDFGDPDLGNAQPQTDFQPVYRVDSMDSLSSGAHVYGYVVGALQYDYGVGFYGRDFFEIRQSCDSYISNNGPYNVATNRRANCSAGSNANVSIHQNEKVYGTVRSNGIIATASPYGGKVCSDFDQNCPKAGATCQGAECAVPGLPSFSTWSTYCPTNQGNVTTANGDSLTVAGNSASQKCWGTVTVGKGVLTLSSTTYPYFIDTLDIASNGRINFAPNPSTGTITLYVRKINNNNRFNGNQVYNINNKPYQLRINYLGTDNILMNGTAAMNAFVVAPYAQVDVQGNFTFQGGIKATRLTFTGNGTIRYDESGDITTLKNITYDIRNMTQRYR